jgi:superfamily II DNA or RNA helicase
MHQHEGEIINITHNITPRGETQERAIDYMLKNEKGILQLSPGVGKTVISIYMIAQRKRKSLILVHRDSLADQWRERFLQFTNLKTEDISRLTSAKFEDALQKPIIISTTQTFISLLKRKRKDFLIALNDAKIGIFIADEVHTSVGAPTFSECSIHMPSKYTYGLSATPYRYDGNGDIIEYHLGPIFVDEDTEGTMDARVSVFLLNYDIDTPARRKYIWWGGEFQRSRYLNMMKKSKPFQEAIRGLLNKLKDDRNLLCMVE